MQTLRNKVRLIGRLGADPSLITFPSGIKMVRISLATHEPYKDNETGKWSTQTQWHRIICWGKQAERMSQMIAKGTEIVIEGRLVNRTYEKNGERRFRTEIEANDFLLLLPKESGTTINV